jgi:hypothetical protein
MARDACQSVPASLCLSSAWGWELGSAKEPQVDPLNPPLEVWKDI